MNRNAVRVIGALAIAGTCAAVAPASKDLAWVLMENGRLVYGSDSEHNRIPDFSTAGYEEGNAPIPEVPVKMRVEATADPDATARIQGAIEEMGKLPLDERGIRG